MPYFFLPMSSTWSISLKSFDVGYNGLISAFLLQQKLAKKDGAQIDRNRDIEHLWEFYQRYKRNNRVEDLQREEQRLRESGTFSANFGEYVLSSVCLLLSFIMKV